MLALWYQWFHLAMRFGIAALYRNQTHSATDAQNMRIHREHRVLAGEQQHAADGLGAYAFERK